MGVMASDLCSCSENPRSTEFESLYKKNLEGSNRNKDSYSMGEQSNRGKRSSMSDIETGDALFDSLKLDRNLLAMKMQDDLVYNGGIFDGMKSGKGVIKHLSGVTIFDGYFKDDLYEGEGTLVNENGFVYCGVFKKGLKSGKGSLFSSDSKYKYEGEWCKDMKSGAGSETYPDGSSYLGDFLNNKKNGKGFYYMNDGSTYEGEFQDDKIHGSGKFVWIDNKIYEGQWQNNSIDGFGVFIRNEKIYIGSDIFRFIELGNFKEDKKNGYGLYLLKNKNILVGNFINGEIEGLSLIFPLKGAKQMCFMSQSKPKILINDENEKKNIKLSREYKNLMDFFQNNKNLVKSYCQD